jgi:hypothetical protein
LDNHKIEKLKNNPIKYLLEKGSIPVKYLTVKNFEINEINIKTLEKQLRNFNPRISILNNQKKDGIWVTPESRKIKNKNKEEKYQKIIILNNLRKLLDYSCSLNEGYNEKSLEFLLKDQFETGYIPSPIDIEYMMPNGEKVYLYDPQFCGEIISLCINFELEKDNRIKKAFQWFERNQRIDGGFLGTWHIKEYVKAEKPEKKKFREWWKELLVSKKIPSHVVVSSEILNAYVSHSIFRKTRSTKKIAKFVLENSFKKDVYNQVKKDQLFRLKYHNNNMDILKLLDLTTQAGLNLKNIKIRELVQWLIKNQRSNGSWLNNDWITLKATKIFFRLDLL